MSNLNKKQIGDEAIAALPKPYQKIDDEFLKAYKEEIEALKSAYESRGGIYILQVDGDDSVLCRVPSSEILKDVTKYSERVKDGFEQDAYLLGSCLLYPSMQVVRAWASAGAPGLINTYGRKLLELSKTTVEAEAKKP